MASIRKRKWQHKGETRTAWVLDYTDRKGRHLQTFGTKKAADAALIKVGHDVQRGVHTADSDSVTVAEACRLWIERVENNGRERSTVRGYRQNVDLHIVPYVGTVKLSRLTAPDVDRFLQETRKRLSRAMTAKVMGSLRRALSDAMRRGDVAQNVAREVEIDVSSRDRPEIEIPTKTEVRDMLAKACPRFRPILMTALFAGLRASELRGLTWDDIDFDQAVLHVRQRADRWNDMGETKSKAGRRKIIMAPILVNTLKEWKLRCPKGDLRLVFPNGAGKVERLWHIVYRFYEPLQLACGLTRPVGAPKGGEPTVRPRYRFHALRHWYASWLIDQGLPAKRVQEAMGHSSIVQTYDVYGKLFPLPDDERSKLASSAAALVG